jgi:V-type H+-transporting ATPase subunit F
MGKKRFSSQADLKVALIGDEDTVAGFCLAGVGLKDVCNFLVVDTETKTKEIEDAFNSFVTRKDIGVVILNQHVAEMIRHEIKLYQQKGEIIPTILEIPSKDQPYDPKKDPLMQRVQVFFGANNAL